MSPGIHHVSENSVIVTLSELESGQIPDSVWNSSEIKELKIQKSQPEGNWTTHPPLSWFESRELKPPCWNVPESIAKLEKLESLYLVNLDISALPDAIAKLHQLRILGVSLNKLQLSNELSKFKQLNNLEVLTLPGNHFDAEEMEKFKDSLPEVKIKYREEID